MKLFEKAQWITTDCPTGDAVPEYRKSWDCSREITSAELTITALGVYESELNGRRVGHFVLAPGWTSYENRLQVQRYDVTSLLRGHNTLCVRVGKGWYASPMPGWIDNEEKRIRAARQTGLIAELHICYADGGEDVIATDYNWSWQKSQIRFSEIYDGESYDAGFDSAFEQTCVTLDAPMDILIPQEGEEVREMDGDDSY